ncbi:AGE family epimerase/isomerase [Marinimicrobium sp. C6131]|uniref:AGE family epimerase/isomerase n=1 Tax=Marinimicrobium sp. C6131 TaxID=3022676 RepID=UPI00223D7A14|nr:AGE family epimerase/isomerase [Marinimicrobium sp. C6131]UZJ44099.1 AGE family epimerase/isomerase [Marinimicrobium sp. C6131]
MALHEPAVHTRRSGMSQEFYSELLCIADWWLAYAQDPERDGFYGEVGVDNVPVREADKGIVLNTRILWFFSELAQAVDDPRYRAAAERGYRYLLTHFLDEAQGGFFWTLDASGRPKDTKKQVYAQAFAIYALVAYYQLTGEPRALQEARSTFELLERHTVDGTRGGYLEAFNRGWGVLDDVRLSDKDLNFPKTMNTHLHVVEAYTTLYQVDARASVADALRYAIDCFDRHIINKDNFHLRMFMDHNWEDHSPGYTYGHDIECSWLLAKATESLNERAVSERLQSSILGIAEVCLREAMGEHGEMYDGFEFATQAFNHERVWWVQAEAMVGYYKAYTLSGNKRFVAAAERLWSFIKRHHRADNGEWLWLSTLDDQNHAPSYKLGPWKGPYHNGRAMLEMLRLLK